MIMYQHTRTTNLLGTYITVRETTYGLSLMCIVIFNDFQADLILFKQVEQRYYTFLYTFILGVGNLEKVKNIH